MRAEVPRLMETSPRQGLLYAAAAQKAHPTALGNMLLTETVEQFPGVARVLRLGGEHLLTAMRTSGAVITTTNGSALETWNSTTGSHLGTSTLTEPITKLAPSFSPYLIASADARGRISLWNMEHLRHPVERNLGVVPPSDGAVVALGFVDGSTRLLVASANGTLIEFDALRHRLLRTVRLYDATLGALHSAITAGLITQAEYAHTPALIALRGVGILSVQPNHLTSRIEIPARELSGEVTALTYGENEHTIAVGTTDGTILWTGPQEGHLEATGRSVGVAVQGQTLFAANELGLASTSLQDPAPLSKYTGRAAAALLPGPGGPLAIDDDGTVTLLGEGGSGINLQTSSAEATLVTTFGPEGDLLEAKGPDQNQVEELVAVRPRPTPPEPGSTESMPIVRHYAPSSHWWTSEPSGSRGLFVDNAELTHNYVLAGGQDPTGTAVVLVWNARTGRPVRRLPLVQSGVDGEQLKTQTPAIVASVTEIPKAHEIVAYSELQELLVFWSTRTWQRVQTIYVGPIGSVAVSPGETTLLVDSLGDSLSGLQAGNAHTTLRFISIATGETDRTVTSENATLAGYAEDGDIIEAVKGGAIRQLSGDGHRLSVPEINVETGEITTWSQKAHSTVLAVGARSGTIRLTDLQSRRVSAPLPAPPYNEPLDLSFDPSGNLLATSEGRDEHLAAPEVWDLNTRRLIARACQLIGAAPTKHEWRAWTRSDDFDDVC
jgi:WD40 repeat protein